MADAVVPGAKVQARVHPMLLNLRLGGGRSKHGNITLTCPTWFFPFKFEVRIPSLLVGDGGQIIT
jgi:hypothetical protein